MLSGDNGILQKATDAKTQTGIGQEKEIVTLAYNSALAKKVGNGDSTAVTAGDLTPELTNQGATADGSNPITVTFTDSKRQYTINSNGTIEYAGIQSEEETVTATNVYATVCTNGTLVFSNTEDDINKYLTDNSTALEGGYEIENITDSNFYIGNSPEDSVLPSWFANTNITRVKFLNKVVPQNVAGWFIMLTNLNNVENITNLNTSNVTNMSTMFGGCSSLTSLDLSGFDTSNVTDMNSMFYDCSSLTSLNLASFDTTNVTDMNNMFSECSALTSLDLSKFNTSNVTNMSTMFGGCSSLTSLNLASFDTTNVTDMKNMFYRCEKLTSLNVSNFNTSNVTNMSLMFIGCEKLTSLNVSSFDTTKVTDMNNMFAECSALTSLDLSKFNTSNVTNMKSMFIDCPTLQTIYVSNTFVTTNVTESEAMFDVCTSLKGGNNTTYNSSFKDKTYARIDTASTPGYFTSK